MPQTTETKKLEYLTVSQATLRVKNNTIDCLDITDSFVHTSNTLLWKDEATPLASALMTNTSLKKLSISDKQGGWFSNDFKIVLEGLKGNKHLHTLSLHNNNLNDEDIKNLAGVLAAANIKVLILHDNNISDSGAGSLADKLKENISLSKLDLSRNQIQDQGAQYLLEALKTNTNLRELNLKRNLITGARIAAITKSLTTIKSLKRLYLQHNNYNALLALDCIVKGMEKNYSLIQLEIDEAGTDFSEKNTQQQLTRKNSIIERNRRIYLWYRDAKKIIQELEARKHQNRFKLKYKEAEESIRNAELHPKTAALKQRLQNLRPPVKEQDGLTIPIQKLSVTEPITKDTHPPEEPVPNESYPTLAPTDLGLERTMPIEREIIQVHPLPGGWLIAAIVLLVLAGIGLAATGGLVGASFLLAMPLLLQFAYFSAAAAAGLAIIALLSKGIHSYLMHNIDNSVKKEMVNESTFIKVTGSLNRNTASTSPAPPPRKSYTETNSYSPVLQPVPVTSGNGVNQSQTEIPDYVNHT